MSTRPLFLTKIILIGTHLMFCSYSNLSLLQHFIEVAVDSRLLDVLGHPGDEGISVLEVGVKVGLENNQIEFELLQVFFLCQTGWNIAW